MDGSQRAAWTRRRRLACQSVAFLITMVTPMFLYWAARTEADGWVLILLGVMAAGMALAIGVS